MPSCVTMYEYHAWANQTMLNRIVELPSGVYNQEVKSIFPSVAKVMAHIYTTDWTWLTIMKGTPMTEAMKLAGPHEEEALKASPQELSELFKLLSARYQEFFRRETDLNRLLLLDNPYTEVKEISLDQMVMQVMNHGTYHRGNVSAMLRQMGHASVMTEYALFWYAGGTPNAASAVGGGQGGHT
ncbi:damage-inducible protein DinB [Paenibacillus sambharensis]|uniref:Damage-inducible protein DinB n=1 Tax=Paenibacillus sambharensis TaxID=1803190 RepID=A0A2W1KZJ9_9BACL|nr:DinB family protein [Paenibacillus sambharensis]PZD93098.1 damage-inducible protein DinB [Paenibacillus sambharensis]